MAGEGYDDGATRGGKWGCAVAGVVGTPIFAFLLLVDALGDCAPDTACHKGFLAHVLLPTLAIAGGLGLIVRYCVNWLLKSR